MSNTRPEPDDVRLPAAAGEWFAKAGQGPIVAAEKLEGGAASAVYRLGTANGSSAVIKIAASGPDDLWAKEASGLTALGTAGAFPVPRVLAVRTDFLLLEDLGTNTRGPGYWTGAGHRLARQHTNTSARFGWTEDNYLGHLPQHNPWTDDGHEFFARYRILRYLSEPLCVAALNTRDRTRVERLADRLPSLIPPQPAALLHGDLWYANLIPDRTGRPTMIDPAVYYGWPEAELSMLYSEGHVDEEFFAEYQEIHPLEKGWRDRFRLLHIREQLSMIAHFGDRHGSVGRLRMILDRFVGP